MNYIIFPGNSVKSTAVCICTVVHPLDLILQNATVHKVLSSRSNSMFHLLTKKNSDQ